MERRTLGQGLVVSAIGLGCAGMSNSYGAADEAESLATIDRALELGVTLFDTADGYGGGHNEELLGRALRGRRDRVVLATKFGTRRDAHDPTKRHYDGSPEHVKRSCEASLRRLGVETIDLYYLHRLDYKIPIEETVGAMAELVREGKIRYLGISEVKAENLRRAHAVHPFAALQSEWSLWSRDPETSGTYAACRELGVGFVAYGPLGRGFLGGDVKLDRLSAKDQRATLPRFSAENFEKNERILGRLKTLADEIGVTTGQLALMWLLSRGDDVVPIPGTKRRSYLEQNVAAAEIPLRPEQVAAIDRIAPVGAFAGERNDDMTHVDR